MSARTHGADPADAVRVTVNGLPATLEAGTTLAAVVDTVSAAPRGLAVALDRQVVPRARWGEVVVHDGAAVEIVTAAAGG